MLRIFARQSLIFLVYLCACSYFLFNHSGGADMAFLLFLNVCIAVHLIVMIALAYTNRNLESERKWSYWDVVFALGSVSLFFLFVDPFFDFMWWLTSKFQ